MLKDTDKRFKFFCQVLTRSLSRMRTMNPRSLAVYPLTIRTDWFIQVSWLDTVSAFYKIFIYYVRVELVSPPSITVSITIFHFIISRDAPSRVRTRPFYFDVRKERRRKKHPAGIKPLSSLVLAHEACTLPLCYNC